MFLDIIQHGDSLPKLFGKNWQSIYLLEENEEFRKKNPDPDHPSKGNKIYSPFPTRRSKWLKNVKTNEKKLIPIKNRLEILEKIIPKKSICAEIGVGKGYFSNKIIKITTPKEIHLIDPWHKQDETFNFITKKFDYPFVKIHRYKSKEIVNYFDEMFFDWVYIDGDHSYASVYNDIKSFFSKIKIGGIISGHDYCTWRGYGVIEAVNNSVNKLPLKLICLTPEYTSSYVLKKYNSKI